MESQATVVELRTSKSHWKEDTQHCTGAYQNNIRPKESSYMFSSCISGCKMKHSYTYQQHQVQQTISILSMTLASLLKSKIFVHKQTLLLSEGSSPLASLPSICSIVSITRRRSPTRSIPTTCITVQLIKVVPIVLIISAKWMEWMAEILFSFNVSISECVSVHSGPVTYRPFWVLNAHSSKTAKAMDFGLSLETCMSNLDRPRL